MISHSIEDIGRDVGETIGRLPRLLQGRAREARCTQLFGQRASMAARALEPAGPEDRRLVSRHASMITPCERQSIAFGRSASHRRWVLSATWGYKEERYSPGHLDSFFTK